MNILKRCGTISQLQKTMLMEFIKNKPKLMSGRFNNEFTKKDASLLWQEIATNLNSVPGGAKKDWTQWRKTWQDIKKNTKGKASKIQRFVRITGGGKASSEQLTAFENEVLELIAPVALEGQEETRESAVEFSFVDEDPNEPQTAAEVVEIAEDYDGAGSVHVGTAESASTSIPHLQHSASSAGRSNSGVTVKTRVNKTRRLEASLNLTKELLTVSSTKNKIDETYYNRKLEILEKKEENRRFYEEKKLLLLEKHNDIANDILQTLQKMHLT